MDVIVGTVGKAHGIRGDVVVHSRTDSPKQRFKARAKLRTEAGRVLEVVQAHQQAGVWVVSFAGISDRSSAETLRGIDLWMTIDDEAAAVADVFHDSHLIGLKALDLQGNHLGEVVQVLHLPAQDTLVIQVSRPQPDNGNVPRSPKSPDERLVPFVKELVPQVDLAAGFITINAIGGLLADIEDDRIG